MVADAAVADRRRDRRAGRAGRPADGRATGTPPCAPTPTRRSTTGCAASRRSSRCAGGSPTSSTSRSSPSCGWPVTGPGGDRPARRCSCDALGAGADVVGGCPHLDDGGTRPATETLLEIAAEHGVGRRPAHRRDARRRRSRARRAGRARASHRVPAPGDGQPLRQPRHAAGRAAARTSPRPWPRPASPSSRCRRPTSTSRAATASRRCPAA